MANDPSLPLTGGCNCGAVRFEVSERPPRAVYCHCRRCQRRTGTAAAASAFAAPGTVRVVAGAEHIGSWKPGDGFEKDFCRECGSALFARDPESGEIAGVRLGAFDERPRRAPRRAPVRRLRGALGAAARRRPAALPGGPHGLAREAARPRAPGGARGRCRGARATGAGPWPMDASPPSRSARAGRPSDPRGARGRRSGWSRTGRGRTTSASCRDRRRGTRRGAGRAADARGSSGSPGRAAHRRTGT